MVKLIVSKNVVLLPKDQEDSRRFVLTYLVKFEEVTKTDYMEMRMHGRRKLKTVKERRCLFNEDDLFVRFSRGILELIPDNEYEVEYTNQDSLTVPQPTKEEVMKLPADFDLREDQIIAVLKCLIFKRGVVQLPTGIGKSIIIACIIKLLNMANPNAKILVLAPTLSTVKNINDTLVYNGLDSKVFAHPNKEICSPVTTSLVQSLISQSEKDPDLLKDVSAVFYDECLPYNSQVLLPNFQTVQIGEIYEDDSIDEVLSYNIETDMYEPKKIVRKYRSEFNDRFCKVYYEDKLSGKLKGVTCTRNHKIYTQNRGYVPAEELTSDDIIKIDYEFTRNWKSLLKHTYVPVKRVTLNVGKIAKYKYNIEVEDNHNYFANNVLVSNCHHASCDTWNRLNELLPNVEYSIGFSALSIDKNEIYIKDFKDLSYNTSLIVGSTGKVLMHIDPSYYIEKGIIARPLVFRIQHNEPLPVGFDESKWNELSKVGLMSTVRTNKVANITAIFNKYGRKILIFVSERNYAYRISEFLYRYGITNFGISFGSGEGYTYKGVKDEVIDGEIITTIEYNPEDSMGVVDKFNDSELNILIATSHLDEGVDVKGLDACILAGGGKKDRRIIQRVGRVLRKTKNGKYAYIIDFTDSASKVLSRQSNSRLKVYKEGLGVSDDFIYEIPVEQFESEFIKLEQLSENS